MAGGEADDGAEFIVRAGQCAKPVLVRKQTVHAIVESTNSRTPGEIRTAGEEAERACLELSCCIQPGRRECSAPG